jgi:hypothetical protein
MQNIAGIALQRSEKGTVTIHHNEAKSVVIS